MNRGSLINHLLKKTCDTQCESVGDQIDRELTKYENLAREIRKIKQRRADADIAHENAVASLGANIRSLQGQCDHPSTTYHGDPAGGSDSFMECDVCGAEV